MKKLIANILTVVVIGLLSGYILLNQFMPDKVINYFGFQSMVVLSPSMEPEILVNDQIVIKAVNEEDIEVGSIITFKMYIPELRTEGYVTHYIGAIEEVDGETIYYTMGAGAEEFDKWRQADGTYKAVTYDDVVGEYWFTIPFTRNVRNLFQNPLLVGVIGLNVVVIYMGVRYLKGSRDEEE